MNPGWLGMVLLVVTTWTPMLAEDVAAAFARGDWPAAISALEARLAADPEDHEARALLGIVHHQAGDHAAAIRVLDHPATADSAYAARALYCLAMSHSALGHSAEAGDGFARLLAEHPDSPEAARVRGLAPPAASHAAPRGAAWHLTGLLTLGWDSRPIATADLASGGEADGDTVATVVGVASWQPAAHFRVGATAVLGEYIETDVADHAIAAVDLSAPFTQSDGSSLTPQVGATVIALDHRFLGWRTATGVEAEWSDGIWIATIEPEVALRRHSARYDEQDGAEAGLRCEGFWTAPDDALVSRVGLRAKGVQASADAAWAAGRRGDLTALGRLRPAEQLTLDLSLGLHVDQRRGTLPGETARRDDVGWHAGFSATRELGRGFSLQAGIDHRRDWSPVPRHDAARTVVTLGVGASY